MGSIVPGAGAVPGAGREDPGEGSRGEEERGAGIWGDPRVGSQGKKPGKENGIGTVGPVGGEGRWNEGGKQVAEPGRKGQRDPEGNAGKGRRARGERGEMKAEREMCLFQKRNQEKLHLVGICRRPLRALWGVCVYKCVGREAAVVTAAAGALTCKLLEDQDTV